MRRRNLAFTLVEMLTVIAITAVLLTIIVLPIYQSFNLTRAAEAFSNAQDLARRLTEKISNEIGNAVSVRGTNGQVATTLNGTTTSLPAHSLVVQVLGSDQKTTVDVALPWTKLDIIPPAETGPGTGGAFVDPISGKIDPTLKTFKGQVQTPVTPSSTLVRYSIGLRDPFTLYNDPYSGILMSKGGGRDNLFTLYRSVVAPYVYVKDQTTGLLAKTPNTSLFAVDSNGNIILDDPRFLVPDRDSSGNILQDSHNLRVYHWLGENAPFEDSVDQGTSNAETAEHQLGNYAHTVVQTEVSRYDMIMPQYDLATRKPAYDGTTSPEIPRLTPLIQFRPTVVSNDPAAGEEALRAGEETDNAGAIAPDVYKTQYGLWNNAVVRSYPPNYAVGDPYTVGFTPLSGTPGFSIFVYNPTAGGTEFTKGVETFDTYTYDNAASLVAAGNPVYPFTMAARAANGRSGWLANDQMKPYFTPYHLLPGTGKIVASNDISEVGNPSESLPNNPDEPSDRPNLPTVEIPNAPLSPISDTSTSAVFSGTGYDINTAFNVAWNQHAYLQPNIQRFIDLRTTLNEDGTHTPLYPQDVPTSDPANYQIKLPDGSMLNRVRIVPGTDVIVGPDQNPGSHYGHPVRYVRVTGTPGVNQYRINYTDLQEPNNSPASPVMVTDNAYAAALGLQSADLTGFDVDVYSATNFVSATIQPRYKVGYVQLESDPNLPIPQGYISGNALVSVPFKIDYRFQFTGTLPASAVTSGQNRSDIFAVDYDTRQLMQVLLTIRNYPQSDLPNPQTVTLKATASLKNVTR